MNKILEPLKKLFKIFINFVYPSLLALLLQYLSLLKTSYKTTTIIIIDGFAEYIRKLSTMFYYISCALFAIGLIGYVTCTIIEIVAYVKEKKLLGEKNEKDI